MILGQRLQGGLMTTKNEEENRMGPNGTDSQGEDENLLLVYDAARRPIPRR